MEPNNKTTNRAFIGSVLVILLVVLGGFYLWNQELEINSANDQRAIRNEAASIEAYNDLEAFDQEVASTDTDVTVGVENVR